MHAVRSAKFLDTVGRGPQYVTTVTAYMVPHKRYSIAMAARVLHESRSRQPQCSESSRHSIPVIPKART